MELIFWKGLDRYKFNQVRVGAIEFVVNGCDVDIMLGEAERDRRKQRREGFSVPACIGAIDFTHGPTRAITQDLQIRPRTTSIYIESSFVLFLLIAQTRTRVKESKVLSSINREYQLVKLTNLSKNKLDRSLPLVDFYQLLSVARDASLAEIKAAYHRALLTSHPDKRMNVIHASRTHSGGSADSSHHNITTAPGNFDLDNAVADIALLKEAYAVLANTHDRAAYDAQLRRRPHDKTGPRPAAVVSLEEFDLDVHGVEPGADGTDREDEEGPWCYGCRCGGWYRISTAAMEKGQHLVGCSSCSEVIWVGYEVVSDEESNVEGDES